MPINPAAAESARQSAADELRAAYELGRDHRAAGRPYESPAPIYSPADLAYDDGFHRRPYTTGDGFNADARNFARACDAVEFAPNPINPAIRAACRAYDRIR